MLTKRRMRKRSFQISMKPTKHSLIQTSDKYMMQPACRQTISKITLNKAEALVSTHLVLLLGAQKQQLT